MSRVTVVHLVRKCNGPDPLERFMKAYRETTHEDHDFVLACKGFDASDIDVVGDAKTLMLPDTGWDIGSYRRAASLVGTDFVCFLNSWSRPLIDGWLSRLHGAASRADVGIAGCTASHEVDPHIRTNAFCMRRSVFMDLDLPEPRTREQACALEVGPGSITRQAQRLGLRAVVVSRQLTWALEHARSSHTFRSGKQEELLVADNRTEDYETASADRRLMLQHLAWGCTE